MPPGLPITAVLCGLCWGLAATVPLGWLAVPVGALCLVWPPPERWQHAAFAGLVAATTTQVLALHWLPEAWSRFAPGQDQALWVTLLALPFQVVPMTVAVALASRHDRPWSWAVSFAGLGALGEWIQPMPSGPSLFLAEGWMWLWPAALVGRAGLDGLLMGWARYTRDQPRRGGAALLVATLVGLGFAQLPQPPGALTLAVLQPNVDPDFVQLPSQRALRAERLLTLADRAEAGGADLALAPEGGWPEDPGPAASTRRALFDEDWASRLPTVLGVHARSGQQRINQLVHSHHPERRVTKQVLVPVAERRALGLGRDRFVQAPSHRLIPHDTIELGGLICYEDLFPSAVSQVASADVVVAASHDGWTSANTGSRLHLNASRLVAVETGRWVGRPTTNGRSAWIGPAGRTWWQTPWMGDDGHGLVGLWRPGAGRLSLGARLGPWLPLVLLALVWRRDEH